MKPAIKTATAQTPSLSRRTFVQTAAGVVAGAAAMGWIPAASHARMKNHRGAADALRIGLIGIGGQGRWHVKNLVDKAGSENVSVGMLCDVYRRNLKRSQDIAKIDDKACVIEYEKILDNKDIDAVLIATPDHWHVKIAIEAMQAGKDVYVEKPLSHTIEQAIACRDAVRKTGRVDRKSVV